MPAAAAAEDAAPASSTDDDASSRTYVWYACFGSNILLERFDCYLKGGRIAGMAADMPGASDPSPPERWATWESVPHRLFFAHSSPTWNGGGVAFVDVDELAEEGMGTTFRLYRVTLAQFNSVLAQENGMDDETFRADPACVPVTPEEADAMASAWIDASGGDVHGQAPQDIHAGVLARLKNPNDNLPPASEPYVGPKGSMRSPSERWYGYVRCVGARGGEPVLTFTCPPSELAKFRSGEMETNPPCEAYESVIARGLAQIGWSAEDAGAYLKTRASAPMTSGRVSATGAPSR
jgi:histone deacetylase 6